jgi:hypothetical protein
MPASDTQQVRRGGQLPTVIFWSGVGLAPVAAALVLFSSEAGGLRVAAVLAILAVVLIGLSITLRPDARGMRSEVEDMVLDEIDALREDIRQDIANAARATHRASAEKLQALYETVETLRAQVAAARGEPFEPAPAPSPPPTRPAAAHQASPVGTAMVGGGVVRHTETVQVTTRQTIVDGDRGTVYGGSGSGNVYGGSSGNAYGSGTGNVYGSARVAEPASAPPHSHSPSHSHPPEESWTEQRLRERLAEVRGDPRWESRSGEFRAQPRHEEPRREERRDEPRDDFRAEPRRPRPYERDDEPTDDARWTGLRAGDRWAEVRADERGHEVRMGERWAEVRRDDGRRDDGRRRDARHTAETRRERRERENWSSGEYREYREEPTTWSGASWGHAGAPGRAGAAPAGRASVPPALPASGPEPASAWTDSWRDDRERERERERYEPGPANPRPRRPEYEMSDERWR